MFLRPTARMCVSGPFGILGRITVQLNTGKAAAAIVLGESASSLLFDLLRLRAAPQVHRPGRERNLDSFLL
jgi:hypothetical protein